MTRRISIAVVADGDPRAPGTNSGVALGITTALEARDDVIIHSLVDSTPSRVESVLLAAVSWRPRASDWRNQKRKGRMATWLRSRRRDTALARSDSPPDLILHVRNTYRPATTPYVVFLDGTASLSQKYWPNWRLSPGDYRTRLRLEYEYFDRASLVATAGTHVAAEVIQEYGQSPSKVVAVGGGTNESHESREPQTGSVSDRRGDFTFLFVGREFERKGGPELLAAFATLHREYPATRLVIAGPPKALATQSGVEWLGYVSDRSAVAAAYSSADAFCLLSKYEPYGLAVQEALAHSLPCIVSDRGALPEIVGDAGIAVDPEAHDSIVSVMRTVLTDGTTAERMRAAAPRMLEGRSWSDVADRLMSAVYESRRSEAA